MPISSDLLRGHTDTIILAQLARGDNYGYEINKNIQQLTNEEYGLKEATLYTAFKRLEQNNLIRSYWGDENSGARRRYYAITEDGRRFYEENKAEWQRVKRIIDCLIGSEIAEGGN